MDLSIDSFIGKRMNKQTTEHGLTDALIHKIIHETHPNHNVNSCHCKCHKASPENAEGREISSTTRLQHSLGGPFPEGEG